MTSPSESLPLLNNNNNNNNNNNININNNNIPRAKKFVETGKIKGWDSIAGGFVKRHLGQEDLAGHLKLPQEVSELLCHKACLSQMKINKKNGEEHLSLIHI